MFFVESGVEAGGGGHVYKDRNVNHVLAVGLVTRAALLETAHEETPNPCDNVVAQNARLGVDKVSFSVVCVHNDEVVRLVCFKMEV